MNSISSSLLLLRATVEQKHFGNEFGRWDLHFYLCGYRICISAFLTYLVVLKESANHWSSQKLRYSGTRGQ